MGEGQKIAGLQQVEHGGRHILPFPKGLRLCIIGMVLRVTVKIKLGLFDILVVQCFEFLFHNDTTKHELLYCYYTTNLDNVNREREKYEDCFAQLCGAVKTTQEKQKNDTGWDGGAFRLYRQPLSAD